MTPAEQAALFRKDPGFQGALARLVRKLDPTMVETWLAAEIGRGTPPQDIAKALGELMAAISFGVVMQMPPSIDKLGYLNGDLGILGQLKARLERRFAQPKTPGGVLLANGGDGQ